MTFITPEYLRSGQMPKGGSVPDDEFRKTIGDRDPGTMSRLERLKEMETLLITVLEYPHDRRLHDRAGQLLGRATSNAELLAPRTHLSLKAEVKGYGRNFIGQMEPNLMTPEQRVEELTRLLNFATEKFTSANLEPLIHRRIVLLVDEVVMAGDILDPCSHIGLLAGAHGADWNIELSGDRKGKAA